MPPKDLTGQRFGKLTVLHLAEPTRSPGGKAIRRWHCVCDCGTELDVNQNALTATRNGTTSCGCSRIGSLLSHKIGERFGKLEIIGFAPLASTRSSGARSGYLCRCDCGREVVMTSQNLSTARSCGCEVAAKAAERIKPEGQNVLGRENGSMTCKTKPGMPPTKASKTGVRGVYWNAREQRYIARIGYRNRNIIIGRFKSLEAAARARAAAEEEIWPQEDES